MEVSDEICVEGCNFLRQHLTYSLLSGRPLQISQIRPLDDDPGIKNHEVRLISMFEKLSNGSSFIINKTGTKISFQPGLLQGGEFELDCNGISRCLSYFLEPLLLLAPFCKTPLNVTLKGVTNAPNEISVDAIRVTWLPIFDKFVLNSENLSIKVNARGFLPDGGGHVVFTSPIVKTLRPVMRIKPGKICKIRGLAYVCKVSPSLASRMIDSAKKMLRNYISDVYITLDQRKGPNGGLSPGFGIFLTAETTEGVFYHGEAMSNPRGSDSDQLIPEDVGEQGAKMLLNEIYRGGCLDTTAQTLAATFMTLCEKDVSKFLFGPLSLSTVHTLRMLKLFFGHTFKIDEQWKLEKTSNEGDEKEKLGGRVGSRDKALLTCVGAAVEPYASFKKANGTGKPAVAHSIPCRVSYTGPAPVSSYFITENHSLMDGDNAVLAATFRGRLLWSHDANLPDHFKFYAAKKAVSRNGDQKVLHLDSADGQSLRIWDFDATACAEGSLPMQRSINFLKIASDLAQSDSEDSST